MLQSTNLIGKTVKATKYVAMTTPRPVYTADFETLVDRHGRLHVFAYAIAHNGVIRKADVLKNITLDNLEDTSKTLLRSFLAYLTSKMFSDYHLKQLIDPQDVKNTRNAKRMNTCTIYFHNLSRFDGYFLLKAFRESDPTLVRKTELVIRDQKIYGFNLRGYENDSIYFRDSYLLLPSSLQKLGIELAQGAKIIRDDGITPDKWTPEYVNANHESILQYCSQDATLLGKVISKFRETRIDVFAQDPTLSRTLPSYAYKVLKQQPGVAERIADASTTNREKEIRDSYRGGIVDVYIPFSGGHIVYVYDIRSSYPYVRDAIELPRGLPFKDLATITPSELESVVQEYAIFVHATVHVREDAYRPLLGVRHNGTLIYPVGVFTGYFYGDELLEAVRNGDTTILNRGNTIRFKRGKIFGTRIQDRYNARIAAQYEGKHALAFCRKILRNSLYGRLGRKDSHGKCHLVNPQQLEILEKVIHPEFAKRNGIITGRPDDIAPIKGNLHLVTVSKDDIPSGEQWNMRIKAFGYDMNHSTKELYDRYNWAKSLRPQPMENAVQLAAAITARARIRIHRLKRTAFHAGISVAYSDTDSLILLGKEFPDPSQLGPNLGDLKLEGIYREGYFLGPKVYYLEDPKGNNVIKWKGRNVAQNPVFNREFFIKTYNAQTLGAKSEDKLIITRGTIARDLHAATLKVDTLKRTASVDSVKRARVYDALGKWVDTKPHNYAKLRNRMRSTNTNNDWENVKYQIQGKHDIWNRSYTYEWNLDNVPFEFFNTPIKWYSRFVENLYRLNDETESFTTVSISLHIQGVRHTGQVLTYATRYSPLILYRRDKEKWQDHYNKIARKRDRYLDWIEHMFFVKPDRVDPVATEDWIDGEQSKKRVTPRILVKLSWAKNTKAHNRYKSFPDRRMASCKTLEQLPRWDKELTTVEIIKKMKGLDKEPSK